MRHLFIPKPLHKTALKNHAYTCENHLKHKAGASIDHDMLNKSYHEQTCSRTSAEGVRTLRDCTKSSTHRSCERDCTKTQYFVVPAKETVQETQRSSFLTPLAPLIRGELSGKSP